MNDYGKSVKAMKFSELVRQRELWRKRSKENSWFYSLPMHQAVVDEIERRRKNQGRRHDVD